MSDLTKRAMAAVLLEQLEELPPDRITVKSITDACGLTRNTFYYHFHDVYELLTWAFRDQADSIMSRHDNIEDWQAGLEEGLTFLYERPQMVMHIHRSISFDTLLRFVDEIVYRHARAIVAREAESLKIIPDGERGEKSIALAADFYTNAVVGAVLSWIRRGMPDRPELLSRRYNEMFRGTVDAALSSSAKAVRWL